MIVLALGRRGLWPAMVLMLGLGGQAGAIDHVPSGDRPASVPLPIPTPASPSIPTFPSLDIAFASGPHELRLVDGRTLRLADLALPGTLADRRWHGKAKRLLDQRIQEGGLSLAPSPLSRLDRHGRLQADLAMADGRSLRGELLDHGLAMVLPSKMSGVALHDLLARERRARAAKKGIWSDPSAAPKAVDDLSPHLGTVQIVKGRVWRVAETKRYVYVNFGADWREDFTLRFNNRFVEEADLDLAALDGLMIEARGVLEEAGGPLINVSHIKQIEVFP